MGHTTTTSTSAGRISQARAGATARGLPLTALGAALLLAGCSADSIMEGALEQVDGIDDVDFDTEEGSFSISGEDGELGADIDPETGEATFRSDEGEISTSPTDEVPDEIAEAVDLPDAFEPGSMSQADIDGGMQWMLQGEIEGDFDALLDEVEDGVRAAGWPQVERQLLAEGHQATVVGASEEDADDDRSVMVTLTLPDGEVAGMLQVVLVQ